MQMLMQMLVCDAYVGVILTLMLIVLQFTGWTRAMHACDVDDNDAVR